MIDNLKDAIEHATQVARNLKAEAKAWQGCAIQSKGKAKANECLECAKEHEQLAEWLTELQERREADRWIPVTERLPEEENDYLVCREYRNQVHVTIDHFVSGGFVIFCCDVTHWKPLPKPYESESE